MLFTQRKSSQPLYTDKDLPSNVIISSELTILPDRVCLLWCFTRDCKLRNTNSSAYYRYGLSFQVNHRTSHALICILLSGDICVNPGPINSSHQPLKQNRAKCIVINAPSLKSLHVSEGKQICNLSRFQELVYSEAADLFWVTETWLNKDIVNAEILPHGYTIYRKDRETRSGGGVLLAVKTNTFISSSELVNRIPDLEVTSVELITQSKRKLLICCCYRPPNAEHIWFDKFNTILSDLSSRNNNIIICGDFNLPKKQTGNRLLIPPVPMKSLLQSN